jgi:hypothetical protein
MFGAVEEKAGAYFPGGAAIKEFSARVSLSMLRAVFLLDSKIGNETWCARAR